MTRLPGWIYVHVNHEAHINSTARSNVGFLPSDEERDTLTSKSLITVSETFDGASSNFSPRCRIVIPTSFRVSAPCRSNQNHTFSWILIKYSYRNKLHDITAIHHSKLYEISFIPIMLYPISIKSCVASYIKLKIRVNLFDQLQFFATAIMYNILNSIILLLNQKDLFKLQC